MARAPDSRNAKTRNKQARQESLREQLAQQKHVEHVVEILDKLTNESEPVSAEMIERYKIVIPNKLKLINKYIPDLKAVEVEGNLSGHSHEDWLKIMDNEQSGK